MEIIRVSDVTYEYENPDDTTDLAVKGVSLSVEKGEWLSIIGHNGSGKSTLVKLLNGLFLPKSGSVLVDNIDTRDEQRIWDIRQKVGMIFQNPDNQMVATIVEEDVA
ncbi:MAG: ATP-binding cassette domain-containing protein, partial [Candidatus Spyradocola sp.]